MTAAALPFATCDPFFMEEEPLDGPWNDAVDEVLTRLPVSSIGSRMQRRGNSGRMAQPIDMLRWFTRTARIGTNGRVDDEHANVRIRKVIAIEKTAARNKRSAPDRLWQIGVEGAFPDTHPPMVGNKPELRTFSAAVSDPVRRSRADA